MLYRSIVGRMPEESVNRMVEDHLQPPVELVPELPQYLSDSIMRAMALNQELRFQNVAQFKEALQQQKKVLSVDGELKRRKTMRGISIAAICLLLLGAGVVCRQVYVHEQQALYDVEAQIAVWMPDVNAEKMEEIRQAGLLGGEDGGAKQITLEASDAMLDRMVAEYDSLFEKVELEQKIYGAGQEDSSKAYLAELSQNAKAGTPLPAVFESSGITPADGVLWDSLGALETTYDTLDKDSYHFFKDEAFAAEFEENRQKKQIPVSFRAPVLYVNTYMVEDWESKDLERITSLEELSLDGKESFCVSAEDLPMYQQAFGDTSLKAGGAMGYEPFLKKETAYYLGNTDDYEAVRTMLGGIYHMVVLEDLQKEGKVKGSFTHYWSISGALEGEEKEAADSLVYYLMGESAQDVFNLQDGNGLSLNKTMLETYVKGNDEFKDVVSQLKDLKMQEYGEGSK